MSTKDKIPELSRNKVVYQVTCPGCNRSYISKTDRCLLTQLSEHTTQHNSAIGQQILADLQTQYDRLNDLPLSQSLSSSLTNLIFNNYKILFSSNSTTTDKLLLIKALCIKFNRPELNSGLKASKEPLSAHTH